MELNDGFIPITAIFYAVFHPTEGTKIINQTPSNIINSTKDSLFNFNTVRNYIIPKPQLCNKMISIKIGKYKVIGYPVNIQSEDYIRNSFNFNFCFVFPYNSETASYELTIKRIGKMFKVLEEQNYMLLKLNKDLFIKLEKYRQITSINELPGFKNFKTINLSSIESLISQIFQDLNNYSECCIPLDSSNSIDIKLFPILPPPLDIEAFQVPILLVKLNSLVDVNWDPTMIKILPFINGINSIKKISELSDSDYILTKQCIQHLMHYKCLQIIDIFQFSNIYAPTNNIDKFLKIPGLSERCQSYVVTDGVDSNGKVQGQSNGASQTTTSSLSQATHAPKNASTSTIQTVSNQQGASLSPSNSKDTKMIIRVPPKTLLFYLYRSLNQGQTVKQWFIQHAKHLRFTDIRRFINFGILNGLIYRVHSYPILTSIIKSIETENTEELDKLVEDFQSNSNTVVNINTNTITNASSPSKEDLKYLVNENSFKSRRVSFNYRDQDNESMHSNHVVAPTNVQRVQDSMRLIELLKGFQNMDAICTELRKSRSEIEFLLDSLGSNGIINS